MNQHTTVTLEVKVPQRYADAFVKAITGNDTDILLAVERTLREAVDTWPTGEGIEVAPGGTPDEWDETLAELRIQAQTERRELVIYGPHVA